MSGSIRIPPANPRFNLKALVIDTFRHQDDAETNEDARSLSPSLSPPVSPTYVEYDSDSSLSPLPSYRESTPPAISASKSASANAPRKFIILSKLTRKKKDVKTSKPPQKKKSDKITPTHRKAKRNGAKYASRKKRRADNQQAIDAHLEPRENALEKLLEEAESISCNVDMDEFPQAVASTAYTALGKGTGNQDTFCLDDLVGEDSKFGFKLQTWDGSKPMVLVDRSQRVIGVLAGHPDDKDWPALQEEAAEALESRRSRVVAKEATSRRGPFVVLACGVSHGGGQKTPGNLCHNPENAQVLKELNELKPFKRLAGFATSVMGTWSPDLFNYYKTNIDCLHCRYPTLTRVYASSIFSAVSYNFGPRTVCYRHKDFANLAFGWCAVTALGSFDYTKGGHLILWDLHLVVEFPPGSTILLPSAIIGHSNTTIGMDERRYSFAQYTAGALFRWVDNGFQTRVKYVASLSPELLAADAVAQAGRWQFGLSLLSTLGTVEEELEEELNE